MSSSSSSDLALLNMVFFCLLVGTSLALSGLGMRLLGYLNCGQSWYQYHSLFKLTNSGHYTIIDFNEVDIRIYLPEKVIFHRGR